MDAIEEIRQAIGTLERLNAESVPGPWTLDHRPATGEHFIERRYGFFGPQVEQVASGLTNDDAVLIVTLHCTIDAQLALLRAGLSHVKWQADHVPDRVPSGIPLDLARAINGGA